MDNNALHRVRLEIVRVQTVSLTGPPIDVAARGLNDFYDLWFEHVANVDPHEYTIYTLATGEPVPWRSNGLERTAFRRLGLVITPADEVWHVYLYVPEVMEAWRNSLAALAPKDEQEALNSAD